MNCVDRIEAHSRATPEHIALLSDELSVTYGQLSQWSSQIAEALIASGVLSARDSHERVGLLCPDGLDYVVLCLGILRAGGCVVPIAGEYAVAERLKLIETTAVDSLVLGPGAAWDDAPGRAVTIDLPSGAQAGGRLSPRGDDAPPPSFSTEALAAMNPAFIRFSSGTTGQSKGVILSHGQLAARIDAANKVLHIGKEDRVIWILPMAHHFAVSMMLYLMQGATTVLVKHHMAGDVIAAGQRFGGTVLYASPFHHAMLATDKSGVDWPALRLAVSTAFALSDEVASAFAERFGQPLCQALGVIEAGLPLINIERAADKPESVGRPTPGFEVSLRDEQGQPVPAGEVGELWLRGPGMLDGYLVPWKPGDEVFEDGWFRTGDLAKQDEDGDVFLVGRRQSVINVAGLKCFPEEIEAVLCEHPQVKEARVIGKKHPRMGTIPIAEVVPVDLDDPPSAASLMGHCKQSLAAYKRPLTYSFVASLEKTASGKIKR